MEKDQIIYRLALFYFLCATLGVLVLVDKVFLGRPYLTIFSVVTIPLVYLNLRFFGFIRKK